MHNLSERYIYLNKPHFLSKKGKESIAHSLLLRTYTDSLVYMKYTLGCVTLGNNLHFSQPNTPNYPSNFLLEDLII